MVNIGKGLNLFREFGINATFRNLKRGDLSLVDNVDGKKILVVGESAKKALDSINDAKKLLLDA